MPSYGHPADERRVDAALQDEVLEQPADLVVDERGDDGSAQPEAAPQPARDVVLAAALPDAERAGGAHPPLAGIQPEHDLAERDEVVAALVRRAERRGRSRARPRDERDRLGGQPRDRVEVAGSTSCGATIQLPPTAATQGRAR